MDWKATVMIDEEIKQVEELGDYYFVREFALRIAEAQAEISYKVGYEQSVSDNDNWARDTYGYQQGIREVVEWIKQFGGLANKIEGEDPEYGHQIQYWSCRDDLTEEQYEEFGTVYRFVINVSRKEWQAKLKEWGMDNV